MRPAVRAPGRLEPDLPFARQHRPRRAGALTPRIAGIVVLTVCAGALTPRTAGIVGADRVRAGRLRIVGIDALNALRR